jgi:hypothetical protein
MPATDTTLTDALIALKTQYERSLSQATTNASHLREQLSHVNALLLDRLLPSNRVAPQQTQSGSDVPVEAIAPSSAQTLADSPAAEATVSESFAHRLRPKPKASDRKPKAASEAEPGKRSPRPLLPAYEGLTRLEAIAQILQTTPGQDVTTEQVSERLFGKLSAAEHKAERKSLNTQLYKGQSLKLWQKGTAPGKYKIGAPTASKSIPTTPKSLSTKAKAPATAVAKRKSLTLLPAYAELSKGDAIAQVLTAASGEVLHHDTIIQTLYGDLSPEELKAERTRIKTALLTGVKDGKWQKAFEPSSYFIKAPATAAKPKRPGRKPEPSKEPKPEPVGSGVDVIAPVPAAKARAAKPKSGRETAVAKAKVGRSQKTARSKRSELELVELLRKADIQV